MKFLNIFFLVVLAGLATVGCSSDDEVIADRRQMAVGSYQYTSTTFMADGSQHTLTGQVSISKRGENQLTVRLDGTDFVGAKLHSDDTGIVFDLEPQTLYDDDGDAFIMFGVPGFEIDQVQYHGFYDDSTGELTFSLGVDYVDDQYDYLNSTTVVDARK